MFRVKNNLVGPRVREARLRHSPPKTQAEVAEELQLGGWDISRSGVAKIELRLRKVTDIEVLQLASALGVSVSWLYEERE